MNSERVKIERRDIAVIGLSALGGFLFVFIVGLIAKDLATALLVGLLLGVPGGAGGGVMGCLFGRYLERNRKT